MNCNSSSSDVAPTEREPLLGMRVLCPKRVHVDPADQREGKGGSDSGVWGTETSSD